MHITDDERSSTRAGPRTFDGSWRNDLGSVMELETDRHTGRLTGWFTSGVHDPHTYPLAGSVHTSAVAFTVHFSRSASIGAWAGHVDDDGTIRVLWHLVTEPGPDGEWRTTMAGSDRFTRSS